MKFEILGQHIRISKGMTEFVQDRLATCIDRFGQRINRITVTLYDVNGPRAGVVKRCRIAIFLTGAGQVTVESTSHDYHSAIIDAAHRAEATVTKRLDKSRKVHEDRLRRSRDYLWDDYDPLRVSQFTVERASA